MNNRAFTTFSPRRPKAGKFYLLLFILAFIGLISTPSYAQFTVPAEIRWFSNKAPGEFSSHQEACSSSVPSPPYSDFNPGPCLGSSCSCYYSATFGGNTNENILGSNWVYRMNVCPDGMWLSDSGFPGTCTGNPTGNNKCPVVGNPISPLTGNKYQKEQDFIGINGMNIVRFYNSQTKRNIGFGYGWSSNLLGKRLLVGTTDIIVIDSDGTLEPWSNINGVWTGNADSQVRLESLASRYRIIRKNLSVEIYDSNGRLESVADKTGLVLSYLYDTTNGRLVSIANNYGHALQIITDVHDSGKISAIQTPDGQVIKYNYDKGLLTSVVYPDDTPNDDTDNPTRTYHYQTHPSLRSVLTGISDERGVLYATWSYDATGRAIHSTHSGGANSTTVNYSQAISSDPRVTVTNSFGKQTSYHFSTISNTRKVTEVEGHPSDNCVGASRFYTYYSDGLKKSQTDWKGNTTEFNYNTDHLESSRTEAVGTSVERTVTTEYHPTLKLPTVITEPDRVIRYQYDNDGKITESRIEADNTAQITTYTYNDLGKLESVDGPRTDLADITQYTYDDQRNLLTVTNALDHTISYNDYNERGQAQLVTDENNTQTRLEYNARGWLISATKLHPSGNQTLDTTTQYDYDSVGQLTRMTLPDGSTLQYEYDGARRLTAIENGAGERIELYPDSEGNIHQELIKGASANIVFTVNRAYDELSRTMEITGGAGQQIHFGYDLNNNQTQTTNARNYISTEQFDALNRVVKAIDPLLGETSYTYSTQNAITSVTDANGNTTSYTYDGLGNLTQLSSPDTGITTFTYDGRGNTLTRTDANNVVTEYQYDALDRVTNVTYPAAPAENVAYTYDDDSNGNFGIGRLTGISDASGNIHFHYNSLGQIESKTYDIAGQSYSLEYSYDAGGRLEEITYPSGRTVTYGYDSLGQINSITTQKSGGTTQTVVSNTTYMPFGPVAGLIYGNGVNQTFSYDLDYRVTGIETSGPYAVIDRDYSYDPNNNIEQITDNLLTVTELFSYDPLDRLNGANGNYGDLQFAYDAVGNRLQRILTQGLTTVTEDYNYASTSQRLNSIDIDNNGTASTRLFDYDNAGNMIEDDNAGNITAIQYNHANRPASASSPGNTISYVHNSLGQRTVKTVNGVARHFHYDEAGQLIAVTDGTGNTVEEFIYLGSMVIAHYDAANDEVYFAHNDHLNTVKALTDGNGEIVWEVVSQTPFGQVEIDQDPDGDSQEVVFNLRFPGQYFDGETQTSYNYYRTYDPGLGRYVQSDPIGLAGGINTYGYSLQNPIINFDPDGRFALFGIPAVYGGLGLGGGAAAACLGTNCGSKVTELFKKQSTPTAPSQSTDWDEVQKQSDWENYHRTCDRPPPPGLSLCEEAKWQYRQALACQRKRQEWEERWGSPKTAETHGRGLDNVKDRLRNAATKIRIFCDNEEPACP